MSKYKGFFNPKQISEENSNLLVNPQENSEPKCSRDCPQYRSCSAPICPLDKGSMDRAVWYPTEETCTLSAFRNLPWVKNQRKIARKVRNRDFYFTKEMLEQNCVITVATEGLDPDKTDIDDSKAVRRWLKQHPEKRKISEAEKEEARNRMFKLRGSLTPFENTQKRQEIDPKVLPVDEGKHLTDGKYTQSISRPYTDNIQPQNPV